MSLFDWAPFRSAQAAVKMRTLLDLCGAIPVFIHISDGKMGDVKALDILPVEAEAFYVMDRGYLDFGRLFKLHQAGAFFVTRAKRGMNTRRVYSTKTDRSTGVTCWCAGVIWPSSVVWPPLSGLLAWAAMRVPR